jgi:hypothetical protein
MSSPKSYASQLSRGIQIKSYVSVHVGMAELKRQLGRPRPPGMTLSLVNPDSPSCYDGYAYHKGERVVRRLSTDPDDYAWETYSENNLRKSEDARTRPGKIGGVRRNEVYGCPLTFESRSYGGRKARHNQHHVNKGIIKPGCPFCEEKNQ